MGTDSDCCPRNTRKTRSFHTGPPASGGPTIGTSASSRRLLRRTASSIRVHPRYPRRCRDARQNPRRNRRGYTTSIRIRDHSRRFAVKKFPVRFSCPSCVSWAKKSKFRAPGFAFRVSIRPRAVTVAATRQSKKRSQSLSRAFYSVTSTPFSVASVSKSDIRSFSR